MGKQAKVIHISNDEIRLALNVGSEDGVNLNDTFLVYSLSEHEIIDPDTNESLGYLEFVKGTGKVMHLQNKMCTIESAKYKKPVPIKTVKKEHATPFVSAFMQPTIEETVIDGENEQMPFDGVRMYDLAKKI